MTCPKCDSKKVETRGKMFFFFLLMGTASIFFWISIFIPFFWIVTGAFFVGSFLSFLMPKVQQCQECKHAWKLDKKAALKGA